MTIGQDETAQAMAERDPLPQEVTYHVWTADEPAAGLQGERAEVRMFVEGDDVDRFNRGKLTSAFAQVWGEHPRHVKVMREQVERTPETVLRAMLRAYDRAAEIANVAYYRAGTYDERLLPEATRTEMAAEAVRSMLYTLLAGRVPVVGVRDNLADDYQQRLSGKRDLNAPPLEDP